MSSSIIFYSSWFADFETRGSNHLKQSTSLSNLFGVPTHKRVRCTNSSTLNLSMKTGCMKTETLETFGKAVVRASHSATTVCALPARWSYIDAEYKRLRAIRPHAERVARKTRSCDDWWNARRLQNQVLRIWTSLDNTGGGTLALPSVFDILFSDFKHCSSSPKFSQITFFFQGALFIPPSLVNWCREQFLFSG